MTWVGHVYIVIGSTAADGDVDKLKDDLRGQRDGSGATATLSWQPEFDAQNRLQVVSWLQHVPMSNMPQLMCICTYTHKYMHTEMFFQTLYGKQLFSPYDG